MESTTSKENPTLSFLNFQRALSSSTQWWAASMQEFMNKGVSDMLKWTFVTAINDIIRRPLNALIDSFSTFFTVSVEITGNDELFRHFAEWMAAQEFTKSSRELIARSTQARPQKILFTPGKGMHFFWYKNYPAWIWRPTFGSLSPSNEVLRITTLGRDTNRVKQLLDDAVLFSKRNEIGKYTIYADAPNFGSNEQHWRPMGEARTPRAPETLILPRGQYQEIKDDCDRFLLSKEWYAQRGIPYRRGYLFYGSPGSGKSSLAEVLAGVLRLDVALLTLSHPTINDHYISLLINSAPLNSIILIEDIDTMFENRSKEEGGGGGASRPKQNQLTFSGLLNALDGVSAQGGRILVMTTNHIHLLDDALIRDGRIDKKVQFQNATQQQALSLFARFFSLRESDPRCTEFSLSILDYQFSMAKLQGHLLIHQTPGTALANKNQLVSTAQNK